MAKKKRPVRKKKTMQVDPRWLEEIQILASEKAAAAGKASEPPPGGAAGATKRRMTMEVDPSWLEEALDTAAEPAAGSPPPGRVSPPPLPPIPPIPLALADPKGAKKKFVAPIPREDVDAVEPPPLPRRRTTKPPKA